MSPNNRQNNNNNLLLLIFTLLTYLTTPALSQFLNQGNLPACAQSCTNLKNAQKLCIPPTAPSIQKSCFCQSALLQQLYASPAAVCGSTCSTSDQQKLQQWYIGFCRSGQQPGKASGNGAGQGGGSGGSDGSTTAGSASATQTGDGTGYKGYSTGNRGTWWENHSKWIAMVIVLVIAFAIIIAVGILLKKRHDRKRNQASEAPPPSGWAPNSDPHLSFTGQPGDAEKGEGQAAGAASESGMPQRPERAASGTQQTSQTTQTQGHGGESSSGGGVAGAAKGGAQKLKKIVGR